MALKFSELPVSSTLDGTEILPVVKNGENAAVLLDVILESAKGDHSLYIDANEPVDPDEKALWVKLNGTEENELFVRESDQWVLLGGIVGDDGQRGSRWFISGVDYPSMGDVPDPLSGDVFYDPQTGEVFAWDGADWTLAGNIKGPKGDSGDTGASVLELAPRGASLSMRHAMTLGAEHLEETRASYTAPTGYNQPHGSIYLDGHIYMSTRTSRGRIVKVKADDFSVVQTALLNTGMEAAEQLMYHPPSGYLYTIATRVASGGLAAWVQIDPETLALTHQTDSTEVASLVAGGQTGGTDGEFLYLVTSTSPDTRVVKYSIDNATGAMTKVTGVTLTGYAYGHGFAADGQKVYVTGGSSSTNNGWIARINPETMALEDVEVLGTDFITDDILSLGDYIYAAMETEEPHLMRISKTDLSDNVTFVLADSQASGKGWATGYDGQHVWYVEGGSPSRLFRFDPRTLESFQFTLPGVTTINEMVTDGQRYFFTTFTSPAQLHRIGYPVFVPDGTHRRFSQSGDAISDSVSLQADAPITYDAETQTVGLEAATATKIAEAVTGHSISDVYVGTGEPASPSNNSLWVKINDATENQLFVRDDGEWTLLGGTSDFHVGDTPPDDTNKLWIDTSEDAVPITTTIEGLSTSAMDSSMLLRPDGNGGLQFVASDYATNSQIQSIQDQLGDFASTAALQSLDDEVQNVEGQISGLLPKAGGTLTGNLTMTSRDLVKARLVGYREQALVTSTSNLSGDFDHGARLIRLTRSGSLNVSSWSGVPSTNSEVKQLTLVFSSSVTSVTWPSGTKFAGGAAPELDGETWVLCVATDGAVTVGSAWKGVA